MANWSRSGRPDEWTTLTCDPTQNSIDSSVTVYLDARGSRDAFNSVFELDLFATWTFPIGGKVNGEVRLEANNVTNEQDLQRISSRGEVNSSRYIGWQYPRRLRASLSVRF